MKTAVSLNSENKNMKQVLKIICLPTPYSPDVDGAYLNQATYPLVGPLR